MYTIAALYHFTRFDDPSAIREPLLQVCFANDVQGTVLLAREGINGTIAGPRTGIVAALHISVACPGARRLNGKKAAPQPRPSTE